MFQLPPDLGYHLPIAEPVHCLLYTSTDADINDAESAEETEDDELDTETAMIALAVAMASKDVDARATK